MQSAKYVFSFTGTSTQLHVYNFNELDWIKQKTCGTDIKYKLFT